MCATSIPLRNAIKIVMRVRKKKLGDWRKNGSEDREPKCSPYNVKSAARLMSTRGAAASEAKKVHGHLEK